MIFLLKIDNLQLEKAKRKAYKKKFVKRIKKHIFKKIKMNIKKGLTTSCRGQFGLSYFVRKKQAAQNTPTQIPSLKNAQLPLMTGDKPTASAVRLIAAREQQSCSTSPTGSALRALPIVLVEQQFRLLWPAARSRIDRILLTCGVRLVKSRPHKVFPAVHFCLIFASLN